MRNDIGLSTERGWVASSNSNTRLGNATGITNTTTRSTERGRLGKTTNSRGNTTDVPAGGQISAAALSFTIVKDLKEILGISACDKCEQFCLEIESSVRNGNDLDVRPAIGVNGKSGNVISDGGSRVVEIVDDCNNDFLGIRTKSSSRDKFIVNNSLECLQKVGSNLRTSTKTNSTNGVVDGLLVRVQREVFLSGSVEGIDSHLNSGRTKSKGVDKLAGK